MRILPPPLFGNLLPDCRPISVKSQRYFIEEKSIVQKEIKSLLDSVAQLAGATEYTDPKQSDVQASVILELWGMWSTPSLPSLPGQLWPGMVPPDRVLSMGQIELNCVLMLN